LLEPVDHHHVGGIVYTVAIAGVVSELANLALLLLVSFRKAISIYRQQTFEYSFYDLFGKVC